MNSLFKGVAANDAKDLVNFIIMTLHEELNKVKKSNTPNASNIQIDQTNKLAIFNNFFNNFVKENQSIISDIFYATNTTYTQCSGCHITKYNFQTYFFLIFPLEEVRKFKLEKLQNNLNMNSNQNMMNMSNQMMMNNQMMNMNMMSNPMMNMNMMSNPMMNMNMMSNPMMNMNMMSNPMNNMNMMSNPMMNMNMMSNPMMVQQFIKIMQNNNSVNCDDCFEYNQKMECFSGENAMYCNVCKKQLPASYQTFLYTTPEILIIVLNRGKGIEFNVKLEFTETLDLNKYVEKKSFEVKAISAGI